MEPFWPKKRRFFFVFFPKNGKWKKKLEKGERKGKWTCPFLIFPGVYKSAIPNPQALVVVTVVKIFYYKNNLDILYYLNFQKQKKKFIKKN